MTIAVKHHFRWMSLGIPLCLGLCLAVLVTDQARADELNPLRPIDTSSPRATLQGFVETMNEGYETGYGRVRTYLDSGHLFFSQEDIGAFHQGLSLLNSAQRAIDFSALPAATVEGSSRRLTLQLKDILDRIVLPAWETIPDEAAMAKAEFKRWTLPGTEIRIARMETGPRAGEYLFSAETVSRIPEFFEKVRKLPYKPGASLGLYVFSTYGPAGVALILNRVVPARWVLGLPQWAMVRILDQPLWRWIGILLVLAAGAGFVALCYRLSRSGVEAGTPAAFWAELLRPLGLVIVMPVAAVILGDVLRVSGGIGKVLTLSLWALFYLSLTWLIWRSGLAIAESVIKMERLRASSIDSQLIRLMLRLLTIVVAIAVLVTGADRVGLPAYSVVAGLGVGGLAVALAGQQTLANLLGSLIIMFEKPFGIGDWIKVGGTEGMVEDVGFRSTRIRTFHDSLVTIPSSQMVNSLIDNMDRREHREVKTVLNITYDTPVESVETFVEGIRRILESHAGIRQDNLQVGFYDYGPHSLDILVRFLVRAPDRSTELTERQRILLDIMRLAETKGIRFAFPTETLYIESFPAGRPAAMAEGELSRE
jgi:MscS family membrane protein